MESTSSLGLPFPECWVCDFLSQHNITWEMGPPARHDQFGTEYMTLRLDGSMDIRDMYEKRVDYLITFATSEELARKTYLDNLLMFLMERRHIIWRIAPEITDEAPKNQYIGRYKAYSRLTAYRSRETAYSQARVNVVNEPPAVPDLGLSGLRSSR